MDLEYKEECEDNNFLIRYKIAIDLNKPTDFQESLMNLINGDSMTLLDTFLEEFDKLKSNDKILMELIIALNIDSFIDDLNVDNHIKLCKLFSFAKNHLIDIRENTILSFYFINLDILSDENSKSALNFFIQLLNNNIKLIDKERLVSLYDFFEMQSFAIKNELIYVIAELYLFQKNIFTENQIIILLEHIYIFCVHSQYQLLGVATNILKDNLGNEFIETTHSFIENLEQTYNSCENISHYLDEFMQYSKIIHVQNK